MTEGVSVSLTVPPPTDIFYRKVVYQACNVVNYDDIVALFDLAIKSYGRIDVVVGSYLFSTKGHTF